MIKRFNAEQIRQNMSGELLQRLDALEVLPRIDSTNDYLTRQSCPLSGRFRVAIAEHQTLGRGQFGRTWESPPATGLCMSIAYTFDRKSQPVAALSMVLGTAIVRTIADLGVGDAALKWPNDIFALGGKLGGVLTESRMADHGAPTVVFGIGLNLDLQGSLDHLQRNGEIGRIVDIRQCLGHTVSETVLAGMLVDSLMNAIFRFDAAGFAAFRDAWTEFDWLHGRKVDVDSPAGHIIGIADGIDDDGALLVRTSSGRHRVTSGSVNIYGKGEIVA